MTCFIDRIQGEEDREYRRMLLGEMPDIKKSPHCAQCLAQFSHEVEPIDCPYYQEWLKSAPPWVITTNAGADDLL